MLDLLERHEEEVPKIVEILNRFHGNSVGKVRILEAGCGRRWDLAGVSFPYHLTGLDLDAEALRIRKEVVGDLDRTIHGDLKAADFESGQFDVVYSSYVLEHIGGAVSVLDRFFDWVRDGGIVVLRIPDRDSAYGTFTNLSPHWFHVAYYRWINGMKNAGTPGYPPYPTIFDDVVSTRGISKYVEDRGVEVLAGYRTKVQTKPGWRGALVRLALNLVSIMSFGSKSAEHCTLTYVLRKGSRVAA